MAKRKYEPNMKLVQLENQIKKATDREELENLQKEYDKLSKIIQNTNFEDLWFFNYSISNIYSILSFIEV